MALHEALEARLREEPEDEENWLVYADWLLDQGDVRGELIQLERALQRSPTSAMLARRREILERHQRDWVPGELLMAGAGLKWLYGFVCEVRLPWGPRAIEALELLARGRAGRFFTSLDLSSNELDEGDVRALSSCDALAGLRALDLGGCRLGGRGLRDDSLQTLQGSAWFGDLRSLWLSYDEPSPRGVAGLLASPSLRRLGLRGALFPPWEEDPFAGAGQITALDLSDCMLGEPEMRLLAYGPALSSLTELQLHENRMGDDAFEVLVRSPMMRRLETLAVRQNLLGTASARALAALEPPIALRLLSIDENSLGEGWAALERSPALAGCRIA